MEAAAEIEFRLMPNVDTFVCAAGGHALVTAWQETCHGPPPLPHVVGPDGRRTRVEALATTRGVPVPGEERLVEVCCVPDAFASYEGLLWSLAADPPVLSASKCPEELVHMLQDTRPADVRLVAAEARGVEPLRGAPRLRVRPAMLAFAHVLQGESPDPRSGNPFYDEVRAFGSGPASGSECVHVQRLALVIRSFSCNFLHFLAGTLPLAVALVGRVPPDTHFLVYHNRFTIPLLRLVGVPEARMLAFDPRCVYHADELFVVRGLNERGDYPSAETVAVARAALGSALHAPPPVLSALVLIERCGTERRLANIDEVEQAMRAVAPTGFEVVRVALETLPVTAQLALASRCRLLLGTEGAGLSHALCVPDGATVVNVLPTRSRFGPLPSQDGYGYFHHLCSQRGRGPHSVRYRALACPEFDWDSPEVRCPLRALCKLLDEWLGHDAAVTAAAVEG